MALMLWLPLGLAAQNTWEMTEEKETTTNPDQKYLAGAVPEVDGKVVFHTVVEAPGKKAAEVFAICKQYLQKMTKEKNQLEQSRIVLDDTLRYQVGGTFTEWLVFKSSALMLDRTKMTYNLIVRCEDGQADITMSRIRYLYEEERNAQRMTAEEWITDKEGLNKKQTKLAPLSGKFRRKTIDRKDYLFQKFAELLK